MTRKTLYDDYGMIDDLVFISIRFSNLLEIHLR